MIGSLVRTPVVPNLQTIGIVKLSGGGIQHLADDVGTMSGPDHGCKGLSAGCMVLRHGRERAKSLAPGETERRLQSLVLRLLSRRTAVLFRYARRAQGVGDPPFAESATLKGRRACRCIGFVVDIAALREALDEAIEVRLAAFRPAPLLDFPVKIGAKARAGRRIAPGIEESELLELLPVERRTGSFPGRAVHAP